MNSISPLSSSNILKLRFAATQGPSYILSPQNSNAQLRFGASNSGKSSKAGWFSKVIAPLVMLGGIVGLWEGPKLFDFNRVGESSVVLQKNRGGYQPKVHDAGLVNMGLDSLAGWTENHKINTTAQSVLLIDTNAKSTEGKTIPKLVLQVDYEVDQTKLLELFKDNLGAENKKPSYDEKQIIFSKDDDPRMQRIFLQFILKPLVGQVTTLTPAYRAEEFHTSIHFLDTALNKGLKGVMIQEENGRSVPHDIQPIKDQVPSFVKINGIRVVNLDLPKELKPTLNARAEKPLDLEIAKLMDSYAKVDKTRNEAKASIKQAQREEDATQRAALATLGETANIKVNDLLAQAGQLRERLKQNYDKVVAEADNEAATTTSKAAVEAAQIESEASTKAAQMMAEADASITQAMGAAKAKAAELVGKPIQKYPALLRLQKILGSQEALAAWVANPESGFTTIDPAVLKNTQVISVNEGKNAGGLIPALVGQKAANGSQHPAPAPAPAKP